MVTSTTPDPLRSYQVEERIPGLLDRLTQQSQALMTLATHLQQVTGQEGGHTSTVMDTARFLQHMVDKPWIIPSVLGEYRDAIGNLGAWVIDARNQPLQIDYIVVAFPGMELPKAAPSLPETVAHEAKSFAASFVHDYSGVLDIQVEENTCEDSLEEIEVWIGMGRDQAQVLKQMIQDTFSPESGIAVKLKPELGSRTEP